MVTTQAPSSPAPLDPEALRQALPSRIRPLRIVYFAMAAATLVTSAALVFYSRATTFSGDVSPDDMQLPWILSGVGAFMAVGCYAATAVVYQRASSAAALKHAFSNGGMSGIFQAYFSAKIVRAALLEAPALQGLVVMFVAVNNGSLRADPRLHINLLYAVVHVVAMVTLAPNEDDVGEELRNKLGDLF
jgi:hypothetical protein